MPGKTFDTSYSTAPDTGKFRFPDYTTHWKGLVQVRDLTPYKKICFTGLTDEEIANFGPGEFDSAKISFQFEVESMEEFIGRFPETCFDKGISKSDLQFLLLMFSEYVSSSREVEESDDLAMEAYEVDEAIAIGLLTRFDASVSKNRKDLWAIIPDSAIYKICLDHNILPEASRKKTIQKLLDNHVYTAGTPVRPTTLLREVYESFLQLYMHDLKKNTFHFHPRLLRSLWITVGERNSCTSLPALVKQMLKIPYWKPAKGTAIGSESDPEPVSWSNAAFTYQPPLPSTDYIFAREPLDPNDADHRDIYRKAKEGSFDEHHFLQEGRFSFPDYAATHKGLVYIADKTNYKKKYLAGFSTAQINTFSLDDFERNFVRPEWEIRDFSDFTDDLPANQLLSGITGERLCELFSACYSFFRTGTMDSDEAGYVVMNQNDPFIVHGFFEKAGQPFATRVRVWDTMPEPALTEICLENKIKPARNKITMIWDLVNANVQFPLTFYRPTLKFKEYFQSLQQLYANDIRQSTNHWHPLYFESLWEELIDRGEEDEIVKAAHVVLANPYWKDRVEIAVK